MKLNWREYNLRLKRPFGISRGVRTTQATLIVQLEADGVIGLGEATANPHYGHSIASMSESLEAVQSIVEKIEPQDPTEIWRRLDGVLRRDRFAQCALDVAAWDLWGKIRQQPLWRIWDLDPAEAPGSSFTIGLDSPQVMKEKLAEAKGWPSFKIKLGGTQDIETVAQLRELTKVPFRIDANGGWNSEVALAHIHSLALHNVQFIEQPLASSDDVDMPRLFRESRLPLIADESCEAFRDIEACVGRFHGVNIKLMKCGGLTPAREMISELRRREMRVMLGCMTESTVGISAAAQLAPLVDYLDIDGAALLAEDIAAGVQVVHGVCNYANTPGTGACLLG